MPVWDRCVQSRTSCTGRVCLTSLGGGGPSPRVLAESDTHHLWHIRIRTGQCMHAVYLQVLGLGQVHIPLAVLWLSGKTVKN